MWVGVKLSVCEAALVKIGVGVVVNPGLGISLVGGFIRLVD